MDIIEFYKTHKVDNVFDEILYQQQHPEVKDFYQPFCINNGITEKERLFFHYSYYVKPKLDLNQKYYSIENLTIVKNGCHVFSYEKCDTESDVYLRQKKAIDSYINHICDNVKIYNLSDTFSSFQSIDYAKVDNVQSKITSSRDYYFLNNLLDFACNNLDNDEDYIIYTNSDCYIAPQFYEFILASPYDYIEFFRLDTQNDVVIKQNKDGIDGFAITKATYLSLKERCLIPDDLIIGAPYWDAIISNIARKYIPNRYQDRKRLLHTQHSPRWSMQNLDNAGKNNLNILDKLYHDNVIDCRKVEIISDSLIIRIFDSSTDYSVVKSIVTDERFGAKIVDFNYNYLFIEKYTHKKLLTDSSIGTTAGTRIHIYEDKNIDDTIQQIIDNYKKTYKNIAILDQYQKISETISFESNRSKLTKLGIVLAFFGSDAARVKAVKTAVEKMSNQSVWNNAEIAFVELIEKNKDSNFNWQHYANIRHIKITEREQHKYLFQKECLWNIGAKNLPNVDNYIFIDADTYPEDIKTFAKAHRILNYNPNIIYQLGNYVITQKEDCTITRIQMLWNFFHKLQSQSSYCFNPCGGFAISKMVFDRIKGFNPYGFLYGGDILFLYEIDNRARILYDSFIFTLNIFANTMRKEIINDKYINSNIIIKNEDSHLIHVWHGNHTERPYHAWGKKFNVLDFDLFRDITLEVDTGLLKWSADKVPKQLVNFFTNRNEK